MSARRWVVIPAAGRGERFGGSLPKQYAMVAGRPVIAHTLACFEGVPGIAGVMVALAGNDTRFAALTLPDLPLHTVTGGTTRSESVLAALDALLERGAGDDDWALVHDAARPLLDRADLDALIAECEQNGVGGLLGLPVADTLKRAAGGQVRDTVARDDMWRALTPQMFRLGPLQRALRAAGTTATDEAMAMELAGETPALVRGSATNLKITTVADLVVAGAVMEGRR